MLASLILLAISPAQDAALAQGARVYQAPAVRPFEPPSRFGRGAGEGDGDAGMLRAPLVAPVAVEAYDGSYEYARSGLETAYDAGVSNAERTMDARMGPLDGTWRVRDEQGRLLLTLVLMDEGSSRPLEGAFRSADAAAEVAPLAGAERTATAVTLDLGDGRLTLSPADDGWIGSLRRGDQTRSVVMVR